MDEINRLIAGFGRFKEKYFKASPDLYNELARGQQPKALVIACCDSRTDPGIITDCDPGELFVVRNVANLVPPYEKDGGIHGVSAALEFGVKGLNVEHIIILGHALCGGITALMQGDIVKETSEFIGPWMHIAERTRNEILSQLSHKPFEAQVRACEKAAIITSLENLLTFPWIQARVDAGTLQLHGWYFDMVQGTLQGYDSHTGMFRTLVAEPSPIAPAITHASTL